MDDEELFDLRIFMRSGNVIEIDQVTGLEWGDDHMRTTMRIAQAKDAQVKLFLPALDLTQVEAIVTLQRGPDETGA
jgi:hypothetical protein